MSDQAQIKTALQVKANTVDMHYRISCDAENAGQNSDVQHGQKKVRKKSYGGAETDSTMEHSSVQMHLPLKNRNFTTP